jgi:hypothetical protein
VANYETAFGKTIKRRLSILEVADQGTPYAFSEHDKRAALGETFLEPVFLNPWQRPLGAFAEAAGPS